MVELQSFADLILWNRHKSLRDTLAVNKLWWMGICDCGTKFITDERSKSCGCTRFENMRKSITKHGLGNHPLYSVWRGMKERCYYTKSINFVNYGGRDITICEEWKSNFQLFYDWALCHGWQPNLTIERKDVNGNYEPNNCCWIPHKDQASNTRTCYRIEFEGSTYTVTQFADLVGRDRHTISRWLKQGLKPKDIFNMPKGYKVTSKRIGNLNIAKLFIDK